jgi:hypothetical protein
MKSKNLYAVTLAIALALAPFSVAQDGRPLFENDDLSGWEQKVGEWTFENGVLTGKGDTNKGAILVGPGEYNDFELQFKYRMEAWGSGGVGFRLHVQGDNLHGYMMDIAPFVANRESPMAQNIPGLGAIHRLKGDGIGPQDRETRISNDAAEAGLGPAVQEWHSATIRAVSGNLEVSVNGETMAKGVDDEFLAGRFSFGIQLGIQTPLQFKDIQIRELPSEEGYLSLFNGEDLSGWKIHGQDKQWKVEDGIILSESIDGAYSYLATDKEYKNFSILAEFQGLANGNSGLFFHSHLDGTAISGIQAEVQPPTEERLGHSGCLYDAAGRGWIVDPETLTAEQEGAFRLNEWNTIRVDVKDHRIKTWLNGLRIVDFQDEAPAHPSGVIALQIHSGGGVKVNWRNIRIKEL